jgi:hypothetical protein
VTHHTAWLFLAALVVNVSVAIMAFVIGRIIGRQDHLRVVGARQERLRREAPTSPNVRIPGPSGIRKVACMTCHLSIDRVDGHPIAPDSVDAFLHKHHGHAVRVMTEASPTIRPN